MRARRTAPWVAVSLTVAGVVFPFVLNALAGSHANAAKHAQTSCVSLTTARQGGHLVIWIRDEGVGGAIPSAGSGLTGMTDRVAALGGNLRVESPAGHGTIVTAELPCES